MPGSRTYDILPFAQVAVRIVNQEGEYPMNSSVHTITTPSTMCLLCSQKGWNKVLRDRGVLITYYYSSSSLIRPYAACVRLRKSERKYKLLMSSAVLEFRSKNKWA